MIHPPLPLLLVLLLASLEVRAGEQVQADEELAALEEITLSQQALTAQAALDSAQVEADLAQRRYTPGRGASVERHHEGLGPGEAAGLARW